MPRYSVPAPLSLPTGHDHASYFENDAFLANLTGWSTQDIERLRHEYLTYANSYGVIDREGFRKLYVASLLNMTWEAVERDAEAAFRNFDINQTGALDFNEYITACSRMARESSSGAPPMNSSYN
jgi:Ca2+-binding EF-hand superfamily protein